MASSTNTCGRRLAEMDLNALLAGIEPDRAERIERALEDMLSGSRLGRSWTSQLYDLLDEDAARQERFTMAFPEAYRARFGPDQAVADLAPIERVAAVADVAVTFSLDHPGDGAHLDVRVFHGSPPGALSSTLPKLENMGLEILDHFACEIRPDHRLRPTFLEAFRTIHRGGPVVDTGGAGRTLDEAFIRIWTGEAENDGFNRLIFAAGLNWREVAMVRTYARYMRQIGSPYSYAYIERAMVAYPDITRDIVDVFLRRFDPALTHDRAQTVTLAGDAIASRFTEVARIDHERILRRVLNLVLATVRTNYFQRTADGRDKPYWAIKLDCDRIDEMPEPRPRYEIFVSSATTEGVHLRGGKVARGGLRWSDRPEDLRAEILDLFKAQRVKNVVIVPAGAKGGFVSRDAAGSTTYSKAAGIESYKTFVRGLLDLTDNIVDGGTRPMVDGTVCWDADDPYLVVAADKGTATLSDTANALAREYGFWLGDAFASGGSVGYDHKKMGITARGAWEAVKRHFREAGKNIEAEPFTAAGIGDMSGDVFGNGMLLSPHIRLQAAFDHRHIFIDPDPDPAASHAERRRLFGLSGSAWSDYDAGLISAGGGVYSREAKAIEVTPEVSELLELSASSVTPDALIRAILCARVELLWFGGIGTYVKAGNEGHEAAGDHVNDPVRVDANALRCKIVGEGANLGLTQRARVAYALNGGRINTDAIDNAAGVNCSDHEVNIKILLDGGVASADISREERDSLLMSMAEDVERLVLRDNYLQTQAISVTAAQAGERLDRHLRLMTMLERNGQLNRGLAGLPDDETLSERYAEGRGLTRPEIAELLAHTKMSLQSALLASELPDDPLLTTDLSDYFPAPVRDRFRHLIEEHPLRREIIVTKVVNSMINRVGSGFVNDTMEQTGCGDAGVAKAYAITRDVFELRPVWRAIEALDGLVPAALQTELLLEVGALVEFVTPQFVYLGGDSLNISAMVADYAPGVRALTECLHDALPERARKALESRIDDLVAQGIPRALAVRIGSFPRLQRAVDIARLSRGSGVSIEQAATIYFEIGTRSGLTDLDDKLANLRGNGKWDREALAGYRQDLFAYQSDLTASVLRRPRDPDPLTAVERWIRDFEVSFGKLATLSDQICGDAAVSYPKLAVLDRHCRRLIAAGV